MISTICVQIVELQKQLNQTDLRRLLTALLKNSKKLKQNKN